MAKMKEGHWYKFNDRDGVHVGYYCGLIENEHYINLWSQGLNYVVRRLKKIPAILEDLGEVPGIIIDEVEE